MGILNRFRKKKQIKIDPIRPGQKLPEIDVDVVVGSAAVKDDDETAATIHEVVGGSGTNLLIGMPGAYTPTCSESHMPGYLKAVDKLQKLGVDTIAVVTTNDKFVNDAWAKDLGIVDSSDAEKASSESPITVLADGDGDLVQQLGLVEDMGYGIGVRSKRFVMILEDGVVSRIETDEGMYTCENTRADNIIKILTPEGTSLDAEGANMGAVGLGALLLVGAAIAFGMNGGDSGSTASDGMSLLQQFGTN
ncbi:MAG: hypothetical protein SGARI_006331 [Bacillariaceae sp.]